NGDTRRVATECERERRTMIAELAGFDEIAQADDGSSAVRDFDPDAVLARDRRHDAHTVRAQRHRQIVAEVDDAAYLDAGFRLEFVRRDDGARPHGSHAAADTERAELLLEDRRAVP